MTYPWSSEPVDRHHELQKLYPSVNATAPEPCSLPRDRSRPFYRDVVDQFEKSLEEAVRIRTNTIPPRLDPTDTSFSRVAVMYSGGVDCAVLARLLHEVLEPEDSIDLLNVSFENPRSIANARKLDATFDKIYDTPDRLTGIQGYLELCEVCPTRTWRFVEINIPYEEAQAAKEDVLDMMFPNDSIMDFSIALAFYFCARGRGQLLGQDGVYETKAKVFFSGLGADEQLGGYSRHSAAFRQGGYPAVVMELQMDLDRIPSRNLGRDDRILANFAREVRWPFLDESVVTLLSLLRVDQKMDFDMEGGEKIILREVGRKLGIHLASQEKKRAIQFGSRSARMEIETGKVDRVKGHNKQK